MIGLGFGLTQLAVRQIVSQASAPPVFDVLAKYGTDAHMWAPGLAAWADIAGTQHAVADGPVGNISDTGGGAVPAVAVYDGGRPTLVHDANGRYSLQCSGGNYWLKLSAPLFQMSDDFCIVAGVSLPTANSSNAIFSQSNMSNHALPELFMNASGQLGFYAFGGGATLNAFGGPSNTGAGPFVASVTSKANAVSVRRNGAEVAATTLSGNYVAATVGGLGAFATVSPSQFLPGSLYPVIAIKGTVSPEDLAILEAFIEWSLLP